MKYIFFNHQKKGEAFIKALEGRHQAEAYGYPADKIGFILTDQAVNQGRIQKLESLYSSGKRIFFLYPHAARPNLISDIYEEWPKITAQFVVSHEHAEVMRAYGHKGTLYAIGWHLCPIREFQPKARVKNILFGPIHPRCAEVDRVVNRTVWDRLFKLAEAGAIDLTVRWVSDLNESGLKEVHHPNVHYIQGGLDLSYQEIDKADVVIGHQTFAWIAVARGVPTVMMAEDMATHTVPRRGESLYVKSWDKYKDMIRYPLDLLNWDDSLALMERAAKNDLDISSWRDRMIGRPFEAAKFVEIVESYL